MASMLPARPAGPGAPRLCHGPHQDRVLRGGPPSWLCLNGGPSHLPSLPLRLRARSLSRPKTPPKHAPPSTASSGRCPTAKCAAGHARRLVIARLTHSFLSAADSGGRLGDSQPAPRPRSADGRRRCYHHHGRRRIDGPGAPGRQCPGRRPRSQAPANHRLGLYQDKGSACGRPAARLAYSYFLRRGLPGAAADLFQARGGRGSRGAPTCTWPSRRQFHHRSPLGGLDRAAGRGRRGTLAEAAAIGLAVARFARAPIVCPVLCAVL